MLLGTLAAAAVYRSRFFGRESISFLLLLPIALPGIVSGISLRSAIGLLDVPFSTWTIIIGHATFCIVTVYNNVLARFRRMGKIQIEASMDLGAERLADIPAYCAAGAGHRVAGWRVCWRLRFRSTRSS